MPKPTIVANSTSVLDIITIRTVGGLPMTGVGKLGNPASGPTLTAQTTGGSINTTTNAIVDVAFSYTSTPGANGAANGETLVSPTVSVTMGASLTIASILCVFPSTWPAAGAIGVYVGAHGGTLFLVTGSGFPVPFGQNAIQINAVPTSGTVVPTSNTSFSHGFTCTMVHDNDTAQTALNPYVATANTWTNPSPPCLGLFEMGNGTYQISEPDAAWSKAQAQIVTFTISGVQGMGVATWTSSLAGSGVERSGTAQGGTSTTVTLDAGANASDNFYKNALVEITGGTGANQARNIASYVGATKVATVDNAWITTPDSTSTFVVTYSENTSSGGGGFPGTAPAGWLPFSAFSPDVAAILFRANLTSSGTTSPVTVDQWSIQGIYPAGSGIPYYQGKSTGLFMWNSGGGSPTWTISAVLGTAGAAFFQTAANATATGPYSLGGTATGTPVVVGHGNSVLSAFEPDFTLPVVDSSGRVSLTPAEHTAIGTTDVVAGLNASGYTAINGARLANLQFLTIAPPTAAQVTTAVVAGMASAPVGSVANIAAQTGNVFALLNPMITGGAWTTAALAAAPTGGGSTPVSRTGTAQGGSSTTIALDAGSSAINSFYSNALVEITGGAGVGQARNILTYVGATRVATVDNAWVTAPDSTSVFSVTYSETAPALTTAAITIAVVAGMAAAPVGSVAGAVNSVATPVTLPNPAPTGYGGGGTSTPLTSGAAVVGSTAQAVILSGLPAGKDYTGQHLYHVLSAESRLIASQAVASGNYTLTLGAGTHNAGPFSAAPSVGELYCPTP
jgi:hypothetical protein